MGGGFREWAPPGLTFSVGLPPIVRGSICLDVGIREGKNRDPLDGHLSGNFPRECGTRVELHITRTRGECRERGHFRFLVSYIVFSVE